LEDRLEKLGDLGEKRVIEEIISRYIAGPGQAEYLGYPDDARDIWPMAPRLLFSIDGYALEHARLPWRSLGDLGWCAITGVISDHVAKGGVPRDLVLSIGYPRDRLAGEIEEIMSGVGDALKYYKLRLLGGDLNESPTPWIDVALISYTSAKKPPGRCCGLPGDKVIVTGVYGAMGYVVLHGIEDSMGVEWVVEATRRPHAMLETGIIIASNYRSIHASMDVSDGLGYTLLELVRLMHHGVVLEKPPRYHSGLESVCGGDLECIWRHVLNGGEEYGVVLLVEPGRAEEILDLLRKYGVPAEIVGEVVDKPPHIYIGGSIADDRVVVWDQFRGWSRRS
jgi:thiamine-monophosphate kinase